MVIIVRSRNDNGCWTIRGGVALDLLLGERFARLRSGGLSFTRTFSAFDPWGCGLERTGVSLREATMITVVERFAVEGA